MTTLTVTLPDQQAEAIAQFLKRAGFSTFRDHAKTDAEAYEMQDAARAIEKELNTAGFNPR